MKPFNPAKLFAPRKPPVPLYPTLAASLDGARSGKKAMTLSEPGRVADFAKYDRFLELLRLAFERDLVVVLDNHFPLEGGIGEQRPTAFALRAEELWRIPAYRTLWDQAFIDGGWTNAAEMQMSTLLGYSEAERREWLALQRQLHSAWTCGEVYTLVTAAQKRRITRLGSRCFGPPELAEQLTFFVPAARLKPDAYDLVPDGLTLSRVGLSWDAYRTIFGGLYRSLTKVASVQLDRKQMRKLNANLVSNVQFLGAKGWR